MTADPVERFFPPRAERSVLEFVFDRYPFPLALTYRRLHAEMDGQEPIAAAWQLRDAFECLLRFTACLAVADLLRARPAPEWAGALVGLLFKPRGLSLGDWHTLLEDALRPPGHLMPAQRQLAGPRALPGLPELLFRTDGARTELNRRIDGDRDSFVHWRNRVFGHGVFQQERRWYADETLRWLPPLHGFYEALRPLLTEWTLVSDAPGGGEVSWTGAETPRMTRPHEHVPLGEPRLMRLRRTLGARTEDGDLPLGPLLSVQPCGICAQPAAFFFDRYERDRNRHRSFFLEYERGHGSEQRGWDEVRRLAALLPPGFEWERGSYDREEIVEGVEIVFRDFGREYLRPAYLLDAIWRVVAEHPKGYLHVVGPTGTGKTYLVRGLEQEGAARRAPVLPYHVLAGVSTDYRTFLVELVERARERLRFRTQEPQSKGESVAGLQAQLTEFLAELMRANRLDRLIVAIDGLDELPDPDQNGAAITDLLPAAERLPQGCFVLLTGREALRPRVRQGLERLARDPTLFVTVPLTPGGPANRDLVRAYLGEHLPQPFRDPVAVEAALVRSGGVFLYAHHLAEALAAGVFSDVTALPEGPQFYPAYLARLRERVGEGLYERVYLPTLLFLSAARQPVPLTQLQTWGIPRDHLPLALLDLRDFLRVHRAAEWHDSLGEAPTESRYALAHEAFVRFVREDDRLSAEWRGAHATVGRLALVSFTGRWRELDPTDDGDLYALRFTPHHLEQAGLTDAVAGLYGDDGYGIACLEATVVALAQARPQIALDLSVLGVAAFRELVERRGRREHAGKLVEALGQLGRVLRELRRLTEAVATFEEAIAMCRQPDIAAEWSGADTTLAHLLNGKGVVLENLGSLKAAAVCHGEAVRIFSRLVEEKGRHALAAEVATSLDNLGIVLRQLGKDDEALSCHGEAVRIYRIATEAMGGRVLAAHLALALDNFAQALMDSGRAGEAVTPSDEAVRLLRQLVEEGPAGLAPDLAIALGNRSKILRRLGRLADANTCGDESVRVYRRLIHEEGRSELTSGLAVALDTQGLALEALGRLDEGLAAYDEAIRLYRQLGETGGRPELAQDLANALGHRGSVLNSLGRLEEAVASLEESIATRRRLVEQGRQDQVEDLAAGLGRLGTALHSLGRLPEALVEYDEAVRFYEALAEGPAGGDVVASLAIVLNNKARALEGLERWDEALRTYEMSLARLWPTDPRRGVPFPPYLLWTIGYQIRILFNLDRWDLAAQDLGRAVQVLGSFPRDMNDPIAQAGARALDALIGLVRGLPPAARARLDAAIAGQKWAGIVRSWLAS